MTPAHPAHPAPRWRADDPRVARAAAGDASAREALVAELGPLLWALCRRLDPDPDDAYQAAWEGVLRGLGRFDPAGPATIHTWARTVAHRALIDRHRRRLARPGDGVAGRGNVITLDAAGDGAASDGVDELEPDRRRRRQRLEAAIGGLPEPQRRVVVLHHVHGVPLDAIAAAEEVALGTVKSRLHRARARLAQVLGGER